MTAVMIGPFSDINLIVVDDCLVPYIEVYQTKENLFDLSLDGRFVIEATGEEVQKWMWWIANAMAIAAGHTAHGKDGKPRNVHAVGAIPMNGEELDLLRSEAPHD